MFDNRPETKEVTVHLYSPHAGQMLLHDCAARYRVMSCGRRFGKTLACANEVSKFALEHPGTLSMWVAPVYRQTQIAFRLMARSLRGVLASEPNKSELRLELINESAVEFRSTERFDNLRGDGIHFLVMDEAARVAQEAWEAALRPALSDTNGRAIFISTPLGRNWFYRLFLRGLDETQDVYRSFTFPTWANPYIGRADIEEARRTLPVDVFRQEYEAEFLEESAGVFRTVDACTYGELQEPVPGRPYKLSWDPAKHADFSVLMILDMEERHVVAFERFSGVDYVAQAQRVRNLSELYNNASVIMDCTGVGDPLLDMVRSLGIHATGYTFTNQTKANLIENLTVELEHERITFPNIPVLVEELKSFEYHLTPSGNYIYSAPDNLHDDCVMALALLAWSVKEGASIPFLVSRTAPVPEHHITLVPQRHAIVDDYLQSRQTAVEQFLKDVSGHRRIQF